MISGFNKLLHEKEKALERAVRFEASIQGYSLLLPKS